MTHGVRDPRHRLLHAQESLRPQRGRDGGQIERVVGVRPPVLQQSPNQRWIHGTSCYPLGAVSKTNTKHTYL
ncbi:hypothetical protein Acaty_c1571 [Acidithiobacillus caldus ATCC 51756]|uniref:Uncharacterized protein n=1 Tax=Acidithiobacillus caldus (strain ATCC 51756 / DSM 8584 / KU) TaxID=637389 RepID=A0A059ZUY8_ACICK|nr:hypothetical protein Acaty_c1571 [Acidithiobacillus caldus ATCC 51756]